jgi:flagellar hook-associated protein 3 FlgL
VITATRYRAQVEINRQSQLGEEIAKAQAAISTGKRIDKPSDDPIAAARVAEIRRAQADQTVWSRNIQTAKSVAAQVDTAMSTAYDIFNRAKELTLAGASESVSSIDRQAMVQELSSLRTQLSNLQIETTPTGQDLFPVDAPLLVSTSATQRLPATTQRSTMFDGLSYTHGVASLDWAIGSAIDAISTDDVATRRTLADASLTDIDTAINHVTNQRAAQGVRMAQLDTAADTVEAAATQLSEERSSLEDTDVAATVMKLNARTLSLQAAQMAFAKVNSNTLFDYLR